MGDTRERVLKELVATESSYHHDLQVVVDVFIQPLQNDNRLTASEISEGVCVWNVGHDASCANR